MSHHEAIPDVPGSTGLPADSASPPRVPLVSLCEADIDYESLVTEDDTPVDSILSEKQQRLLTAPLYASWSYPKFIALANVGMFYDPHETPYVPDALLSLDVELPEDIHPKQNRSYFIWKYGKPPEVVVEIVSNTKGHEETEKLRDYFDIGISYYIVYDPELHLGKPSLRVYRRGARKFVRMKEPYWFDNVKLGVRLWDGVFEKRSDTWLRWYDPSDDLVPTGEERARLERQRADEQEQRADRLAEKLRELGVQPDA